MDSADLNFDTRLAVTLTQLNRPIRIPPPTSLPGASRTSAAIEEATQHWRRRCGSAAQRVGEQLTQLRDFTLALEHNDRELSESFRNHRRTGR